MTLSINGEAHTVDDHISVAALLESLQLSSSATVVQLNNDILPRDQYGARSLQDGDQLELIRFVGGG